MTHPTHSPELIEAVARVVFFAQRAIMHDHEKEWRKAKARNSALWQEIGTAVLTAAEPFIAARVKAAVEAEREACAAVAKSYGEPKRFKVPDCWKDDMKPSDVYGTGANDAAMWIEQEIRARGGVE